MGEHLVIDLYGVDFDKLNDEQFLIDILQESSKLGGMTVLSTSSWKFNPNGVTAICLLAESHTSIHTYPAEGKAHLDIYHCGNCKPLFSWNFIREKLNPKKYDATIIKR